MHATNQDAQYMDGECCGLHLCGWNKLEYLLQVFSSIFQRQQAHASMSKQIQTQ